MPALQHAGMHLWDADVFEQYFEIAARCGPAADNSELVTRNLWQMLLALITYRVRHHEVLAMGN